jgi:hypothetical protein
VSKDINWDEPLSRFDREYAIGRGLEDKVRKNELKFGTDNPTSDEQIEEMEAKLSELKAAKAARDNVNVARSKFGAVDNTEIEGEVPQGASVRHDANYEVMSKAQLVDEIGRRNKGFAAEDQISTAGTKSELVERLRADDEEADDDEAEGDE